MSEKSISLEKQKKIDELKERLSAEVHKIPENRIPPDCLNNEINNPYWEIARKLEDGIKEIMDSD